MKQKYYEIRQNASEFPEIRQVGLTTTICTLISSVQSAGQQGTVQVNRFLTLRYLLFFQLLLF